MAKKRPTQEVQLKWSRQLDWFEGKAKLSDGTKFELSLTADGPKDRATLAGRSAAALVLLEGKLAKVRAETADRLLSLHNKTWNRGRPIRRKAFAERLILSSLVGYDDGSWEIQFDDGGLFRGHSVLVSLNKSGRVTDATIAG